LAAASPLVREIFGRLSDGSVVERVWLHGKDAFEASIIAYGAAVQALACVGSRRAGRTL
jgi:hypothetical protein